LTQLACGASLAALAVSPAYAQDAVPAADEAVATEDEIEGIGAAIGASFAGQPSQFSRGNDSTR